MGENGRGEMVVFFFWALAVTYPSCMTYKVSNHSYLYVKLLILIFTWKNKLWLLCRKNYYVFSLSSFFHSLPSLLFILPPPFFFSVQYNMIYSTSPPPPPPPLPLFSSCNILSKFRELFHFILYTKTYLSRGIIIWNVCVCKHNLLVWQGL